MSTIQYNDFLAEQELNTLSEIKNFLRIDFDDDDNDAYLEQLLISSVYYIDACCGKGYRMFNKGIALGKLLQQKLVADLYENRESNVSTNVTRDTITTTLLEALNGFNYDTNDSGDMV